jgi:predicted ATPase
MISSIHLEHFKCFADLRLPLAPLTLLTGVNAAGKSSAIQPLVLLHQTVIENQLSKSLVLNGPLLRLGRFGDIVDEVHGRDSFAIGVSAKGTSIRWLFRSEAKDSLVAQVSERAVTVGGNRLPASELHTESFFPRSDREGAEAQSLADIEGWLAGLLYLSTERLGPRETYRADIGLTDKVELGSGGELTPWFLFQHGERQVHPALCLDATTTLARQVEARLADFFPGAGLELKPVEGTNLVTLLIRTSLAGRFHRPQNVGYGLTNILPILAACLAAPPGLPIIIENPEAHLHPAAQAKMGRFAAQVAASGAQVILESHSDHILNGIRRAVKERVLPPESVAIHFFQRRGRESERESNVVSPVINESGVIDHWPKGFFDQFDSDLAALTDWDRD